MKRCKKITIMSTALMFMFLCAIIVFVLSPAPGYAQGNMLEFTNRESFVHANIDSAGLNGNVTVEAWISSNWDLVSKNERRVSVLSDTENFIHIGKTGTRGYGLYVDPNPYSDWPNLKLRGRLGGVTNFAVYDTLIDYGGWTHVALVKIDTTWTVYVNGVGKILGTGTPLPLLPSDTLSIGADQDGVLGIDAYIDEVRISTVARYTSDFTPPSAPFTPDADTKVLYHFDEGSGDTTADASAGGYTGHLGGSSGNPIWYPSTAPLPIQLAHFSASVLSSGVKLDWSTFSEVNNYGFYVERKSATETAYRTVSELIPGAGTSLEEHNYSWTDAGIPSGTYQYRLRQEDMDGKINYSSEIRIEVSGALGVKDNKPLEFGLHQNYPNPFNPSTSITYDLPSESHIILSVYNTLGQQIALLVQGTKQAGTYTATWNPLNVTSGLYFYKLEATSVADPTRSFTQVRKSLLLK